MQSIQGTPININGRTGAPVGQPGPATTTAARVLMPVPAGRQKLTPQGTQPLAPSTTFARYLRVSNVDTTNDLKISFLDGSTVTVIHGTNQEFSGSIPWVVVQATAATVQWEAFAIVAA